MIVEQLVIEGVRNLSAVSLVPAPGMNLFVGANGAGKTSVLEALHCLALGRSFRGGGRHAWISRAKGEASIFAVADGHRLGVRQRRGEWEGRIDGADCSERARFSSLLPLFVFHPDAHSLVEGEPLHRRRLIDQGVFHVEPGFLDEWRRFRRALSQRNAALRARAPDGAVRPWEVALVESGERLTALRRAYVDALGATLSSLLDELAVRVPPLRLELHAGWPSDESLGDALERSRESDRERGFTQLGPQRADLRIRDDEGLVAGRLSRGQQKLVALSLLLSQAAEFERERSTAPVFLLDDVGSELDADHEARIGQWLAEHEWQVWLTGLLAPPWLSSSESVRLFHVEQGALRASES